MQDTPEIKEHLIQLVSLLPSAWVSGDRDKLKQVFINLIRNACEAVPQGETVTCHIVGNANQICISIHNGGEPISSEVLAKLGTPFFTTKSSGNGLGLAIVRRIVEAHGSKLLIESTKDAGTTVSIQLPRIDPGA